MWFYKLLLLNCHCLEAITKHKFDLASFVDDNALRLNLVNDNQQYPAARCAMGDNIVMYQRSASSTAESMNRANVRAREKTAVDPIMTNNIGGKKKG